MPYAVALAQRYDGEHTPARCMTQPKIDGIRAVAYLEGGTVVVQSREGLRLAVPEALRADIAVALATAGNPLDGELRATGGFNATQRAVLGSSAEAVAYHVFDCLGEGGFAQRHAKLIGHGAVVVVPALPVSRARRDIQRRHDAYVAQGYEGLVLRDAEAPYRAGRRYAVQKLKTFSDAEFPIVGLERDRAGLGVLVCQSPGGEFRIAAPGNRLERELMTDALVGQSVTVRYRAAPSGVPRDAAAVGVRWIH